MARSSRSASSFSGRREHVSTFCTKVHVLYNYRAVKSLGRGAVGVEAADVLYVGDSVSSDMAAARNAGMDFCWLNPAGARVPAGYAPAFVIASLAEFPRLDPGRD